MLFPNGKSYLGISNNIKRRMKEHFGTDMKRHPELPISRAIKKYGIKNIKIEVLEEIKCEERLFMREREKYWIKHYNSLVHNNGYNLSEGGDGADGGELNHGALLTSKQVNDIVNDLKANRLTIVEIANKNKVGTEIISRLNNGHTYVRENTSYPIRNNKVCKFGIENKTSKFYNNTELLSHIIEDLRFSKTSIIQLSKKYNISRSIIAKINSGTQYRDNSLSYPLRVNTHITHKRIFTEKELFEIYSLLKDKKISMEQISIKFNCDRKVITDLNNGVRQRKEGIDYPIRKTFKNKPVSTIAESGK